MADVDYLWEPEGSHLHWEGLRPIEKPALQNASLSGASPSFSSPATRQGLAGTTPHAESFRAAAAPKPKLDPDTLMKMAKDMLDENEAKHSASIQSGPSVGDAPPAWLRKEMGDE